MVLLLARHRVLDAAAFVSGYQSAEAVAIREKYGVQDDAIWATVQDHNDVLVTHTFQTEADAQAFLAAEELKSIMETLGVIESPKLQIFNPMA